MEVLRSIRNWRQWPFGVHLALTFIVLAAVALAGVTWYTTARLERTLSAQIGAQLRDQAESLNKLATLYLHEKIADLEAIAMADAVIAAAIRQNSTYAEGPEAARKTIAARDAAWLEEAGAGPLTEQVTSPDGDRNPAGHQLRAFLNAFAEHSEVILTDRFGGTVAATGALSDYEQGDEAWWQRAWQDGGGALFLSRPAYDESAGVTAMLIAVPVVDLDRGETVGVLRSTLCVDSILDAIGALRPGRTGFAMLADPSGPLHYRNGELKPPGERERIRALLSSRTGASGYRLAGGGLYAYAQLGEVEFGPFSAIDRETAEAISGLELLAIVRQDAAEALAAAGAVRASGQNAFLVAILVSLATAALAGLFMTRPLKRLARAAEDMERGRLDTPLPAVYSGELQHLTTSFQRMANRLRDVIESLGARSQQLLDSSTALAGEVAERKRAEAALTRYRDELEVRVAERTEQLKTTQYELLKRERLAAIGRLTERIAMEMRSPLGTISATLFLMRKKPASEDATKHRGALDRAERALRRCDRIVEELFAYAGHQRANPQETDLDAWLEGVLESLKLPGRVTMSRELRSGQIVGIDREQVRAAIECVVTNALDAVEENGQDAGRIQVETHADSDRVEIRIADDGPGVDPDLGDLILEPLLSTRESGVGLGLSRARLIMEEHAGGIEFTSEPGAGATFTLWLPKAKQDQESPL